MDSSFSPAPLPSAELEFWRQIANAFNPGWTLAEVPFGDSLGVGSAAINVHVYVLDTSNGWVASAGMSARRATSAIASLANSIVTPATLDSTADVFRDEAVASVLRASSRQASVRDALTRKALQFAWLDISRTKTFQLTTKERGALIGHWLYIVYRTHSGVPVMRPAFAASDQSGLLDADLFFLICQAIVRGDVTNEGSNIFQMLRKRGGAILAPQFLSS